MNEEKIQQNKERIIELLLSTKREGIEKLIDWLKTTEFFTTPASVSYHLNIKGGLVQHSLNVYDAYRRLYLMFVQASNIPEDTIIITTLLHDLCKFDLYIENSIRGYTYRYPQSPEHGKRSVELVKQFIQLTEKEEMMIHWHMGCYNDFDEFKAISNRLSREHPESHLIYFADHIATLFMDTKEE